MTSYPAERDPQRPPMHPGALLREDILPAAGLPKTVFARRLGISRQTLYDILAERQPVTPPVVLRFARLIGGSAALWLSLQQKHDLAALERTMAEELEKIEPVAD